MSILRTDKIAGLESVNAITGSVEMRGAQNLRAEIVNGNADFNLGSSDFTIECWYNPSGTTGTSNSLDVDLLMLWNNTNNRRSYGLYRDSSGYLGLIGSSDGTNSDMQSYHSYNFSDVNAWYHIAAVRILNTATIYVNGTSIGSATVSGSFYENTVDNLVVGGQLAGTSYDSKIARGFISNMRLIKGKGIYTANFTSPTRQLEVTPETVLLCCHSSQDPTYELTGKTLVAYRSSANDSFPKASTFTPDVGNDHTHGTVLEGGTAFSSLNYMTLPRGTTTQSNRGRGLLGGSNDGSPFSDNIQYINIQSQGNSVDFGNLTLARSRASSYASSTRGIWGGGTPGANNTIDYVTIATTANAINFGDLTVARRFCSGTSSATRGLTAGGNEASPSSPYPSVNVIDYTTIASAANATDFGDLLGTRSGLGALSSPTRALFAGGYSNGSPAGGTNDITYVEIATTGNSVDFGDLTNSRRYIAGVSNNTRGVFGSGSVPGANNVIDYVTIASTGDATDFGDATVANEHRAGISNSIRGVWAGTGSPAIGNTIDYVTIATTGDAADFGDTMTNMGYSAGCSDSHGGLS